MGKPDLYESYVDYQTQIINQFDKMAGEYGFHLIDATRNVYDVFVDLKEGIGKLIKGMRPASRTTSKRQ